MLNLPFSRPLSYTAVLLLASLFFSSYVLAENAVPVRVSHPEVAQSHETLSLSGSITAKQSASLSTKVDGLITKVNVDAGSYVKKGQELLVLDNAITSLELAQAQAATAQAKATRDEAARQVEEAERLIKKFHITESELANRRSNLSLQQAAYMAAQAAENLTREQLARHKLYAPFDGVISDKLSEVGEWVSRGDTVLTLVNTHAVRVDIKVPQERFEDIQLDTPVTIIPDVSPDNKIAGRIDAIVPVSDPQARAFLVRVYLDQSDIKLLPGTSAIAQFELQPKAQKLLLIPRDALLLHPDGAYSVFVVRDGIAWRQPVKLGQFSNHGALIAEGLDVGDQVVVRGNEVLRNQQAVQIIAP